MVTLLKSILDRSFRYTPAAATDIRKTFARVRREQRDQLQHRLPDKVVRLDQRKELSHERGSADS